MKLPFYVLSHFSYITKQMLQKLSGYTSYKQKTFYLNLKVYFYCFNILEEVNDCFNIKYMKILFNIFCIFHYCPAELRQHNVST